MTDIFALLTLCVQNPRQAALTLQSKNLDLRTGIGGLLTAIILGVLMLFVLNGFEPVPLLMGMAPLTPWALAGFVLVTNILLMGAVLATGRLFGGTGQLATAVVFFAWLQFLQLIFQIAITAMAFLAGQTLGGMIALAGMLLLFWIMFNFIAVLHDFDVLWKAIVTFFLGILALSFAISIVLTLLGVQPPQVAV